VLVHAVLGSTSPARRKDNLRTKQRDPMPRPEFGEYEMTEFTRSAPLPRRHCPVDSLESEIESSILQMSRFDDTPRSSKPIKIEGKNTHPLWECSYESTRHRRRRLDYDKKPEQNVQEAFKHNRRRMAGDGRATRRASDFWSAYKLEDDGSFRRERKRVVVRGPTPPRRLRDTRPVVTYEVYLTPSETTSSSSTSSSGDEYWRWKSDLSEESSEDDDSTQQEPTITEVDLIFELDGRI
jgi:hypothetical protein